jgi:1-acyl-sn-glycerol-3-phosphate acyltransferase
VLSGKGRAVSFSSFGAGAYRISDDSGNREFFFSEGISTHRHFIYGSFTLTLFGETCFDLYGIGIFDNVYSKNEEDIPLFGQKASYPMSKLLSDFSAFEGEITDDGKERIKDAECCGDRVHDINMLTVIASESYRTFVADLQSDIKTVLYDRPTVATSEYFKGKFAWFFKLAGCICVNRNGHDEEAKALANAVLSNGGALGIFPEGTRNKTNDLLGEFKYGAASIACKNGAMMVPVAVTGEYKFRSKTLCSRIGKPFSTEGMTVEQANKRLHSEIVKLINENLAEGYGTPEEFERAKRYNADRSKTEIA